MSLYHSGIYGVRLSIMKQAMPNLKPSSKARILIAGYGAIGRAMVHQSPNCQWISLNRAPNSNLNHHIKADLLTTTSPLKQEKIDFVVYTATPDQRSEAEYHKTYVEGLRNLLGWLKETEIRRIFFVSSTSVYGQSQGEEVDESSPAVATSFSGRAIAQAEALLAQSGFDHTIVRFGGIYGNGREMLLRHVRQGVKVPAQPPALTNRIHEEDCAGSLLHLMALAEQHHPVETLYLGVDDEGANKLAVYQFIEQELGLSQRVQPTGETPNNLGKRCLNQRLKQTGYRFLFPSYKQGYGELIKGLHDA